MDIKALKPSSAKLLLHLLVNGGSAGNLSALAASLDMDRKTVTTARQELLDRRFVGENLDIDPNITAQLVSIFSPHFLRAEEKIPTFSEENLPTVEFLPNVVRNYSAPVEILPNGGEDSPRTRCVQADRIGERAKQVEALHFAFGKRFPGKNQPNDESIRILLRLTGDSAEAVDEAFESAAVRGPESPWSYVRAVLTRQKEAKPVAAPALDNDDLPPAPPEMVAEWKRGEAVMKRLGLLPREEDL